MSLRSRSVRPTSLMPSLALGLFVVVFTLAGSSGASFAEEAKGSSSSSELAKTEATKDQAAKATTSKAGSKKGQAKSTKAAAHKGAAADSLSALEAAAKDTTNAKANYRLGVAYMDRDRPIEAARVFRYATRAKPDYIEAWVNLGAAEDANGHGFQAREAYQAALNVRKDDEIALCRMASSLYANGARDSAMDVMRHTLEVHPKSYCSYFTLGVAFADAGMYRDAIRAWEKVIEIAPKSAEAESATESTKLLKEVLGADGLKPLQAAEGVPPGSGGPGKVLPGGGMAQTKDAAKDSGKKPGKASEKASDKDKPAEQAREDHAH